MAALFRLLLVAAIAFGAIAVFRWLFGGAGRSKVKCATCAHCRKLFDDGVMCGFKDKEVYKNPAQIDMCPYHEPRRPLH